MVIKINRIMNDGKLTTSEMLEEEYPLFTEFTEMVSRMAAVGCKTFALQFEEGFSVMFMVGDEKK